MKRSAALLSALTFACSPAARDTATSSEPANTSSSSAPESKYFSSPPRSAVPSGPQGESVRRGEAIFRETPRFASDFVGNGLSCRNCHLDDGRKANSGPLWAAWGMYPAYRKKNGHVNTMDERLRGCFTYSMNASASKQGHAPPPNDPILVDLQAYMAWLSKGISQGADYPGRGYPTLPKPAQKPSRERGKALYATSCALCHGADGQGTKLGSGDYVFPPLWGPDSYNWGAGMHRINTAAGFIKANMPYGKGGTLTNQEAWDVALFINSHERPKDPRGKGNLADTDAKYHDENCTFGDEVDGRALGQGLPAKRSLAKR
ncbi:MAG: c-type cytochrome [Polyangiaceae bacterium]